MLRLISGSAFAAVAIAFALPFGAVSSCDEEEVRFTGVQLVTFDVPPDREHGGELHVAVERRASLLALAALAIAVGGVALTVLRRKGAGWCAAAGLATIQLVAYAIGTASDSADLFIGYGIGLAGFALAGLLLLANELGARVEAGRSIWPPLALAVAVVLPPLGAGVVLALWLLSLLARTLRALGARGTRHVL
jgi:hypothetical protein